jgi:hypothetical protein
MQEKNISLVMIDTDAYGLSYRAVSNCVKGFPIGDARIFTDDASKWPGYGTISVPKMRSMREYNEILFRMVPEHLKTPYFLVVQYDGFIINASEFSRLFYHYDYIGAPWPWFDELNVGNGGFSLRSRKLADSIGALCSGLDFDFQEDIFVCRTNRILLQDKFNCHFPSSAIASHFSVEQGQRRFPTFGFHGLWHLPFVYRNQLEWLVENLTHNILKKPTEFSMLDEAIRSISEEAHLSLLQRRSSLFDQNT